MSILEFKEAGALTLAGINLVLLVWSGLTYRARKSMPGSYYRLLTASPAVAAYQAAMGLIFLYIGFRAPLMHIFYGILVACGATAQASLALRFQAGQRYRGKPLIHAFLGLFVMLLSIRSYMAV